LSNIININVVVVKTKPTRLGIEESIVDLAGSKKKLAFSPCGTDSNYYRWEQAIIRKRVVKNE
jgi:hypothetical protein